jgi:signal transduction histidine kinase/CheY-like chemotaxis protein
MILIVDDTPENIFSLKTILELHSFPVDTSASGEEALKKIIRNNYALIILDVQMPGMDGFELAEIISGYNNAKDIPIIFLSAVNTDKKFITKGYSSGGIDYITKPIDHEILLLKVKTFYRLFEQNRALSEMRDSLRQEVEYRRNAQTETQEKVKELHSILESIPQIAFTAKPGGELEFVNSHWFSYADSSREFPPSHPDDPDIRAEWDKAIRSGNPLELEVRIKPLEQEEYRYHLLRTIPVHEDDKPVKWVGTFTDIEEQKKIARKKDEFISIASHELKTPLTSIKAYIQLLDRATEKDDKIKTYVERTLLQVDKLGTLISELLDISKIEGGNLLMNRADFDFGKMLGNAIDIVQQTYPDYYITWEGVKEIKVNGDEMRIEQVVINYLNNAVKYSQGIKEIGVQVSISPVDNLVVAVRDFGIGISKENLQHIFKKFYRVDNASYHYQGLGIGLYICAEILKKHNGDFWAESEPGKGSTFYFSIPLNA